ncbi:MAG: PEP/pyruvate-binding domain-containing protein [Bacteroidales bacterium]
MDIQETCQQVTNKLLFLVQNQTTESSLLEKACNVITETVSPIVKSASIEYDGTEYVSDDFLYSSIVIRSNTTLSENNSMEIKVFFDTSVIASEEVEEYTCVKESLHSWETLIKGALSQFIVHKLQYNYTERLKELKGIEKAQFLLYESNSHDIEYVLEALCDYLPEVMQYPESTVVRIRYNNKHYESEHFKETQWVLKDNFESPDGGIGSIEIFYVQKFPDADEGPFLYEERKFLHNLVSLISGAVSKTILQKLLHDNTERLKELRAINITSDIIQKAHKLEDVLPEICDIISESFQYPQSTQVRITYDKKEYTTDNFEVTQWGIAQSFHTVLKKQGRIEVFYTQKYPDADEGPFLKEERRLLINMSTIISGRAVKDVYVNLYRMNSERLKELHAINRTGTIIEEANSEQEALQRICTVLPLSWQYPKYTACRISFLGQTYVTSNFEETQWMQTETFTTIDGKKGSIEIVYLKEFPLEYKHTPFLREEYNLLRNIAKLIDGYLNSYKGYDILAQKNVTLEIEQNKPQEFRKSLTQTNKPLQLYFNQQSLEKYVYLDMMKYKVKHILFISTLYDAFMLESEDSFFEKFMGEIYQYSLFSLPRITGVSSVEEALALMETTSFDLVVLMAGIDRRATVKASEKVRHKHHNIPIYLLLNKKNDLKYFDNVVAKSSAIDKIFVWNGDSLILFAMVKSIEDRVNVENDTHIGLVRVILLIEDSPLYYSKYLQALYSIVFDQVRQILPEVEKNELNKICKMRSRPKVLLAKNYEEAIYIFNKYREFILCVISDVEFERAGKTDKNAGLSFISYAKSYIHNLLVILQSSDVKNAGLAKKMGLSFLDKNKDSLITDLKKILQSYLGFGNFIFRNNDEEKIAEASSLREFEELLYTIPDDSFYLHAHQNQFSIWLMARGEILLAKIINSIRVNSYEEIPEKRSLILEKFRDYREDKKRGKIMSFDESAVIDERNIVTFCKGSLGGKGRGLGFVDVLLYNLEFPQLSPYINVLTPTTVIIGTDEFQKFITKNRLTRKVLNSNISYTQLRELFSKGKLSLSLLRKIRVFVDQIKKPIAVRSSSTSEDSITHPFSGVFDTYIVPNTPENKSKIVKLIAEAIKMVYASVYSPDARVYFEAINHKIEDEKMAIILQELIGSYHDSYYYPHISGVAQSYNYYPVGEMKPEEGFAVAAVGLGAYVVNGWKSYRFSPTYPKISVYSTKEQLNSSQQQFYALNASKVDIDFVKGGELAAMELLDISEAEQHGTLQHAASVYDINNDRLEPGVSISGPRVINFANILQHEYIPLAQTIELVLRNVEETFGSPVEIEYAVDLEPGKDGKPTFYVLQIKPLLADLVSQSMDFSHLKNDELLLYSNLSLGNGEISNIVDVVYIKPEVFDKLKTIEMAQEIEKINVQMTREKRKYILIGPGRWGSRDRFLGVPVTWSQISHAKVIVETSLENFSLDSSLGSHFFHNVTSLNIGYFSVEHNSQSCFIKWDVLEKQKLISESVYCKHVRFDKSIRVLMDGKKKTSVIVYS